jgi:hypothetical protein
MQMYDILSKNAKNIEFLNKILKKLSLFALAQLN